MSDTLSDTSSASEHTCDVKNYSNERYANIYRLLAIGIRLLRRITLGTEKPEHCIPIAIDILARVYDIDGKFMTDISANLYMHATDFPKQVHALLMTLVLASKTLRDMDPVNCPLSEYAESRLDHRLTELRNHIKACST